MSFHVVFLRILTFFNVFSRHLVTSSKVLFSRLFLSSHVFPHFLTPSYVFSRHLTFSHVIFPHPLTCSRLLTSSCYVAFSRLLTSSCHVAVVCLLRFPASFYIISRPLPSYHLFSRLHRLLIRSQFLLRLHVF